MIDGSGNEQHNWKKIEFLSLGFIYLRTLSLVVIINGVETRVAKSSRIREYASRS